MRLFEDSCGSLGRREIELRQIEELMLHQNIHLS
jgi:hypothetical protein